MINIYLPNKDDKHEDDKTVDCCPYCDGTGLEILETLNGFRDIPCEHCSGTGLLECE